MRNIRKPFIDDFLSHLDKADDIVPSWNLTGLFTSSIMLGGMPTRKIPTKKMRNQSRSRGKLPEWLPQVR